MTVIARPAILKIQRHAGKINVAGSPNEPGALGAVSAGNYVEALFDSLAGSVSSSTVQPRAQRADALDRAMKTLVYPFKYREPLTARWVKARYKASIDDITKRHTEWELTGPGEIRTPISDWFSPHGKLVTHAELLRLEEPPLQMNPHLDRPPGIDRVECTLIIVFLRRYVRYCVRRKRYAEMQGAAVLHREVTDALQMTAT